MKSIILLVATVIMVLLGFTGIANVYGQEKVENPYFSINIPDNWAYIETSNTPESINTGFGPLNSIALTPNEFSEILLIRDAAELGEKIEDGGIYANFVRDTEYPKNAALESYAKYQINNYGISNITSQQNTTVGNEKSVRIFANGTYSSANTNIVSYLVMHDKVPYQILYAANAKDYEKYLPEFEQMVKSFRFAGSPSSEIENLPDNENETNRTTNFSGANLTELNTNRTDDSNYPEELYDECVRAAGKSFCDFLFKK